VDINVSTGLERGIFIAKALTTSRSEITATGFPPSEGFTTTKPPTSYLAIFSMTSIKVSEGYAVMGAS
jgi:hypothetical protein